MKIGPVDPEIALLNLKKKKRKNLTEAKSIARSAVLLSGLNMLELQPSPVMSRNQQLVFTQYQKHTLTRQRLGVVVLYCLAACLMLINVNQDVITESWRGLSSRAVGFSETGPIRTFVVHASVLFVARYILLRNKAMAL